MLKTKQKITYKSLFIIATSLLMASCNTTSEKKNENNSFQQKENDTQTNLQKCMERGNAIYSDFCVQCHMTNGKGIPNNYPPLVGSNWLTEKRKGSIRAVKYGQSGKIEVNGVTYEGVMTTMGLSDMEFADVLNYVMNSWGNNGNRIVTESEVSSVEK